MPPGRAGIWHLTSRCVRREHLLESEASRAWVCAALGSWLDVLAIDVLAYAIMANHLHVVIRTRPDRAQGWDASEVRRRRYAASRVTDGRPLPLHQAELGQALAAGDLTRLRHELAHPGAMLRAVKEGFARRINRATGAAGHVWEGRYHDVAIIDPGGVLACLVYVELNPFRAGLVTDPADSRFCSARHRLKYDPLAADAPLAQRLCRMQGHPLLDGTGHALGSWGWDDAAVAELTAATARTIRDPGHPLPAWADELMPRLGLERTAWTGCMAIGGTVSGNVLGAHASRRAIAGSRMASDKSGLFAE